MSIHHAREGQPIDVTPYGAQLGEQRTTALFKSRQVEVIRLVLARGKSMPEHKVAGDITIQCLEGRLQVQWNGSSSELQAGQLLFLLGQMLHSVTALEDASALLTIVLHS
jgi:quercetin dioxygenase-like cupin family protein